MVHKYNIKGTPEVYTIAINSCSQIGDWEFACKVFDDMTRKGVVPDEVSLYTLDCPSNIHYFFKICIC
jgi:pentatricopeptide repeat protein